MNIEFRSSRLEKTITANDTLQKTYGQRMARVIGARMDVLRIVENLAQVSERPPERRHQLHGDRDEQFSINLVGGYRLVFEPNHDPVPRREDGGIDIEKVTAIRILDVVDYH